MGIITRICRTLMWPNDYPKIKSLKRISHREIPITIFLFGRIDLTKEPRAARSGNRPVRIGPKFSKFWTPRNSWTAKLVNILDRDAWIHGPTNWSVFQSCQAGINGPLNWFVFWNWKEGIHAPIIKYNSVDGTFPRMQLN